MYNCKCDFPTEKKSHLQLYMDAYTTKREASTLLRMLARNASNDAVKEGEDGGVENCCDLMMTFRTPRSMRGGNMFFWLCYDGL